MSDIPSLFAKAQSLRGAMLRARTIGTIEEELKQFRKCGAKAYGIGRNHENVWVRARRCIEDKPFSNLQELIYPPSGSPDYGRAQYPKSRVLYASWNDHTALEEIGATIGDLVQMVRIRVRHPIELPCQVIGELQFFHAAGRSQIRSGPAAALLHQEHASNPQQFTVSILFDSILAEIFRAPAKRPHDYMISAAYAEWYYKSGGGLIYPSVESIGSMNIAVPADTFDKKFEVLDTTVVRITDYVGYGIFQIKPEKYSSNFAIDGCIDWNMPNFIPAASGPFGNIVIDPAYVGWRKA